MQQSPEIEHILSQAQRLAKTKKHAYVTLEHLTLVLVRHTPFWKCLEKFGVSPAALDEDLELYLDAQMGLIDHKGRGDPKKTNALERVFNRALTQVMFSGRRSMETIDIWLAIVAENNSHSQYFMLKHGVTKQEFVPFWQENYARRNKSHDMAADQADEILEEHCTNITQIQIKFV